ncbi:MAG: helix-hairpin-helix domain-containing protein [Syntrophomonadaceae bacterium]|nr:helix-hairpin-helix domain-containing protein [Syntrophomonadaceae bacterium]MDD3022299.1 helix-hairpin-helix domain-containing protein [Syntrophomonadaceae bacterium]
MENIDKRYLTAGLVLLLIAVFSAGLKYADFRNQGQEEKIIIENDKLGTESSEGGMVTEEQIIQVFVCGEVKKPGVYRLQEGARLYEAVDMAEAKDSAQMNLLDMARELVDGESILVPLAEEHLENGNAPSSTSQPRTNANMSAPDIAAKSKLNINRATIQELDDRLPGIGPALAQRIIDYRSSNGNFKQIEDLKNVSGIGDKKFAAIKELISVR